MDNKKGKKLEAAGWKVASARQFLDLSNIEAQLLEIKFLLLKLLRLCRKHES